MKTILILFCPFPKELDKKYGYIKKDSGMDFISACNALHGIHTMTCAMPARTMFFFQTRIIETIIIIELIKS